MPETYDALIVGTGPAGATLARLLANSGKSVLLIDKEKLPRHKPCAGGVPARTIASLDIDVSEVISARVSSVALDGAWTGRQEHQVGGTCVVIRSEFDRFLTIKAAEAGAEVMEYCAFKSFKKTDGGYAVTTSQGEFLCEMIFACDGVFSPIRKAMGIRPNKTGFCLEAILRHKPGLSNADKSRAIFNLGCEKLGYAWSFPREDEFSVGIGGAFVKAPHLQKRLEKFIRKTPELKDCPIKNIYGGMLPDFDGELSTYARDNIFLIGDAAGFADALTGEGIYYAIRSAQLAAEAVLTSTPAKTYNESLRAEILPELELSRKFAGHFRKFPAWVFGALMSLGAFKEKSKLFIEVLSGSMTYRQLVDQIRQK